MDGHRQSRDGTLISDGDVATQWQGAGGRRTFITDILYSAELYDPTIGTGPKPAASPMPAMSHSDVAAQRQSPRRKGTGAFLAAELYDPATGTWTTTGSLTTARITQRRYCPTVRCWSQGDV